MPRQGDEPVPGYRLQKRLGRGSFGEVWKASGPGGTLAALKFIGLGDNQALREFRAIQRIKQIRHVHLMPLIGIWLIDQHEQMMDEDFLANWSNPSPPAPVDPTDSRGTLQLPREDERRPVELIEAMPLGDQDLFGRLADCKAAGLSGIPPDELLGYLEDAAKAIDFLNSQRHDLGSGLVAIHHGDIKPQNIMLVGGSAQVCDFGLARLLGGAQATSTALAGSPAYMAPESIRDKQPHRLTDQYSLAITYAELRTGVLPFHTQSYMEILNAHLDGKLNLETLPPAERAVLQRATALEPNDRYPTSLEMVHALQRAVAAALPQSARDEILAPPVIIGRKSEARDLPRGTLVPEAPRSTTASDVVTLPLTATPLDRQIRETEPHATPLAPIAQKPSSSQSGRKLLAGMLAGLLVLGASAFGVWQFQSKQPDLELLPRDNLPDETAENWAADESVPHVNREPTLHVKNAEPAEPLAGGEFNIDLEGTDPEGKPLRYEYRTVPETDWRPASDGRVHFEKLTPGELVVEFRALDEQGALSAVVERRWQIMSPTLPTMKIAEAPEQVAAGESLRVVLSSTDPAGESLSYQWRRVSDGDWESLSGSELELPNVEPGELHLDFRAVNGAGLASEVESRNWKIERATEITNSLQMKFRLIPAGEFLMGSHESTAEIQVAFAIPEDKRHEDRANFDDEVPRRRVEITRPFYLGAHEVTKAQFAEFVKASNYQTEAERDGIGGKGWDAAEKTLVRKPEYNWRSWGIDQTNDSPAVNISWFDAVKFCEWLSARDGRTYRLPTEAEWEYACRAGTSTRFSSGDDPEGLALIGNVPDASALAQIPEVGMTIAADDGYAFTAPVGSYQPNAWGLYDMHGNVWEWCSDLYDTKYYQNGPGANPKGPEQGTGRVARGGGWALDPVYCRASYRGWNPPESPSHITGFRVAMDP